MVELGAGPGAARSGVAAVPTTGAGRISTGLLPSAACNVTPVRDARDVAASFERN